MYIHPCFLSLFYMLFVLCASMIFIYFSAISWKIFLLLGSCVLGLLVGWFVRFVRRFCFAFARINNGNTRHVFFLLSFVFSLYFVHNFVQYLCLSLAFSDTAHRWSANHKLNIINNQTITTFLTGLLTNK